MSGKVFANAMYAEGLPEIGKRRIKILLAANSTSLSLLEFDADTPLLSIPWPNIRDIRDGSAEKNAVENIVGIFMRSVDFIPWSRFADYYLPAFWLIYWDDKVQRNRKVLIATITENRRDEIVNAIWLYRDQFHRDVGSRSGPQRR